MSAPRPSGSGIAVLGAVVTLGALAVIPFNPPLLSDWLFRIAMLVMLAVSWNMMASAGMISLGHSAFWGLGGYCCALAANVLGVGFGMSFLAAAVVGAATGLVLALVTGRLRGVFFAVATLALSEGLRIAGLMLPDLTGGAAGLFLAPGARPPANLLYEVAVVAAALSVAITWLLFRTRLRFAVRAMRENEDAAQMLGINPLLFRALISAIAGAMAATAGGFNLWYSGYIAPDIAFTLHFAILAQIAVIIGGINTLAGPVIGAFLIIALSEVTRILVGSREGYSLLIYGVLLVAAISFLPNGLYGLLTHRRMRPTESA
mgnify:CR=1 FL=1